MRMGFAGVLLVVFIVLIVSGCTQTGRVIEENLTPEEEQVLEGFLNESPEPEAVQIPYEGHTEPQSITQPLGCPETCTDQDNCTYDYCSEETDYECVHAERVCPNFVKICPDTVSVLCENTCLEDSCIQCEPDCSEHQLFTCGLTEGDCGACHILDTEKCECAKIVSCLDQDGCCPSECDYTLDSDCEAPEGECSSDPECKDQDNCTLDTCSGTPSACSHQEITECISGDDCCPPGCDSIQDTDCPEEEPELDHLVFTQILYDPNGTESKGEWLEIYNPTDSSLDLSGWTISDNTATWGFPDQTAIGPRSYLTIARDSEGFSNLTGCLPDLDTFTRGLNNPGDQLSLNDSDSQLIDFVAWEGGYKDAYPEWDIGANESKSIIRKYLLDSDSPEDWLSEQEPEPNC